MDGKGKMNTFNNALYFLAIINPVSKIFFLSGYEPKLNFRQVFELAWKSSVAAFLMLELFSLVGQSILENVFRIDPCALKITGGIVVFFIGWKAIREGKFFHQKESAMRDDLNELSIVPLAAPLIAGPGMITIVISSSIEYGFHSTTIAIFLAILMNFLFMLTSQFINDLFHKLHLLGPLIRLTGLLVAAVAVQMILSGTADFRSRMLNGTFTPPHDQKKTIKTEGTSKMNELINNRKEEIELPSPLTNTVNAADWVNRRRKEILALYENVMYGRIPPRPEVVRFEITRETPNVLGGRGLRREVTLHFQNGTKTHTAKALWYLPNNRKENIPVIVGLNFKGNAGCTDETDLPLEEREERGVQAHRWQIPMLLDAGFSLITAPRNHFFPDHIDGRKDSIFALFHPREELTPDARQYTAISAWAWGYSRLLELAMTDARIDERCIWAHGHSRLGKTALWCAANDIRFAGTVSNDSGCCGAALFRDKIGEQIDFMVKNLSWWSPKALDEYAKREDALPFDQHWLAALIAPRPLLIASATEDTWADPFNEYRCAKAVGEVYRLFGANGIGSAHFPAPEQPIFGDRVGYYLRTGKHDVTATDWKFVLEFIRRSR